MAQSLLSKYVWIIDTIYKADRISFKELNSRWLDSEISEGVEIPKRTFDNWRYAIQDMFGLFIENEGKGKYRYYIMNKEDISKNGLRSWIYNTFCVSNALAESQSIKDRILLEYVPSGQEYLQEIIEAMKSNQILNITYHSYWKDEENNFDVEPFCVKLFRQRWYLVARSTYTYYHEQGPRIYCLDRITYLHKKEETFKMPEGWSAEEFFDGCFGIIADNNIPKEYVKLKGQCRTGKLSARPETNMSHKRKRKAMKNTVYSLTTSVRLLISAGVAWNGEDSGSTCANMAA